MADTVSPPTQTGGRPGPGSPSGSGSHIPSLDGVRGVAVLLVLVAHFAVQLTGLPAIAADRVTGSLLIALDTGWFGVDLFFVLSGFLITGILLETKRDRGYFSKFYMRRSLRIFPLYYGFLAAALLALPRLGMPGIARAIGGDQPYYWLYGVNILVARRGTLPLAHFWSLSVEEHFYLVWPLAVLLLSRRSLMALCVVLAVLAAAFRVWFAARFGAMASYVLTPCRMDTLAVGAFCAALIRGPGGLGAVLPLARLAGLAGLAALAAAFAWKGGLPYLDPDIQLWVYPLGAATFGAWLIASVPGDRLPGRLLVNAPLRALGKYSYGMYVYHVLVMGLLFRVFPTSRLAGLTRSPLAASALYIAAGVVLTFIVALASFHLFEGPVLGLKRFFAYDRPGPRGAAPPERAQAAELAARP